MTEAKGVGLKQWGLEIDKKVDTILEFMHKMEVHLDYTSKRIDTQCEKLANRDNRLIAVEDDIQKHKGELTMLKWILSEIGVVAAVAVPIVMMLKAADKKMGIFHSIPELDGIRGNFVVHGWTR